jgi:dynein intermediate chain
VEHSVFYKSHQGSITGIQCHPSPLSELSGLYLTCSLDWTIKLWRVVVPTTTSPQIVEPLKSFEDAQDYIADVSWAPTHPAVFACIDGCGNLQIYNLNVNVDQPVYQTTLPNTIGGPNKLSWSKNGEYITVASLDGSVLLFQISHLVKVKQDDTTRFLSVIRELTTK